MIPGPSLPALALVHGASLAALAGLAEPGRVLLALCLAPALVWLSWSDLRRGEIPDGAVAIIALGGAAFQWHRLGAGPALAAEAAAAGAASALLWVGGGLYFRRAGREALGIGDAKLIGAGTMAVGAASLWALVLLASAGGIAAGLLARRRAGPGAQPGPEPGAEPGAGPDAGSGIPFGPFLAYAILILALVPVPSPFLP